MLCNQCREILSEYIDGALELGEQVSIERHLADCEPCRAVRDDLLQIVHFSKQLPEHVPTGALWARIQSGLEADRPAGGWTRIASWWARLEARQFRLSIPQLAATAAALVILLSIGVAVSRREAPGPAGEAQAVAPAASAAPLNRLSNPDMQQMEEQIGRLQETVDQRKPGWNPQLRAAFERNLSYVDESLLECRHQLHQNPEDGVSQELMLNAYREKVRVLEGFQRF